MSKPEQVTEPKPERTTNKPGHTRKMVHIPNAAWARFESYVDRECLDADKFLTNILKDTIDMLPE
jgi:hypothetical protein